MHNFSQSKNKFGYIYMLTPQGLAEKAQLTSQFLKRKLADYDALQAEISALQAKATITKRGPSAHNSTQALN